MPSGLKITVRITPMPATTPYQLSTPPLPTPDEISATRMPPEEMIPARMPPLTEVMPATTTMENATRPRYASKSWKVTFPSW